jgi:two-component system response regulator HydG
MAAEMIVVSGPLLGNRYALGDAETKIGSAPTAGICIAGSGLAKSHAKVRQENGRYQIVDQHCGSGTFVNGIRATEHWLEDGEQVTVGETVFVFRLLEPPATTDLRTAMLRSCAMQFLFRALGAVRDDEDHRRIETLILELISDLVGSSRGAVLLGRSPGELRRAAEEHLVDGFDFERISERVTAEGTFLERESGMVAVPIFHHDQISGIIALRFPPGALVSLEEKRDTLGCIAAMAGLALESVREIESLREHNVLLREQLAGAAPCIIGQSPPTQRLLKTVDRVAPQETTVLITGESGTGKELIARLLHEKSPRQAKPFVAINCAVLTEPLLESELFGHEKGAFTGAVAKKRGKLELAEGGTVFLDEIGELAPELQAKLLRVLQQREFERVGGTRTLPLDIRLIAATNRDLVAQVRDGFFRDDLYHRLNVIALRTPALRERPGDIKPLAMHFLARSSVKCGRRMSTISAEAEQCLAQYSWPGNVRELENVIERAVILGDSESLLPEDLPDVVRESAPWNAESQGGFDATVSGAKRESILKAWRDSAGDYKKAAALLGLHPNSLLRLIRKLNLRQQLSAPANRQRL